MHTNFRRRKLYHIYINSGLHVLYYLYASTFSECQQLLPFMLPLLNDFHLLDYEKKKCPCRM